jgi:CRP-like cAMP-binding protein
MIHMNLPQLLRHRIITYYSEMWKHYRTLDGKPFRILDDMNQTLQDEMVIGTRNTIFVGLNQNQSIFNGISGQAALFMMKHLKIEVYLHNDYVYRLHDVGKEMFIIAKGKCEKTITELNITSHRNSSSGCDEDDGGQQQHSGSRTIIPFAREQVRRSSQLGALFHQNSKGDEHFNQESSSSLDTTPRRANTVGGRGIDPYNYNEPTTETVVGELAKGHVFGEIALIKHARRGCNVRAVRGLCEIHILPRDIFEQSMELCSSDQRDSVFNAIEASFEKDIANVENENPFPDEVSDILKCDDDQRAKNEEDKLHKTKEDPSSFQMDAMFEQLEGFEVALEKLIHKVQKSASCRNKGIDRHHHRHRQTGSTSLYSQSSL